jgi:hypothetical protein
MARSGAAVGKPALPERPGESRGLVRLRPNRITVATAEHARRGAHDLIIDVVLRTFPDKRLTLDLANRLRPR